MAVVAREFHVDHAQGKVEAALDAGLLADAGYDPVTYVWAPPADHPVFGWRVCPIADCQNTTVPKNGSVLCGHCAERWRSHRASDPSLSVERFVATAVRQYDQDVGLRSYTRATEPLCQVCRVPGHERPAATHGLCEQCSTQRYRRGHSVETFVKGEGRFSPGRPEANVRAV